MEFTEFEFTWGSQEKSLLGGKGGCPFGRDRINSIPLSLVAGRLQGNFNSEGKWLTQTIGRVLESLSDVLT